MWKNIFLESCLLSALIFGGLYINANYIKGELYDTKEEAANHISGGSTLAPHISGEKTANPANISGASSPISATVD